MAEDKGTTFENPTYDPHGLDDDEEQEVYTTQPFDPVGASTPYQPGTPYRVGEQTEMHTMQPSSPACLTLRMPRHHLLLEKISLCFNQIWNGKVS